ncbi:universal stress protein UspA [Micromonospora echinospora]|uniref:Nucleotide-binding universal stress protein, UspA family n=1 Tax=Micromonospora echinospora TaxID=1877 RepID=A0A1C4UER4_MICEC|nr:universal stress protein [Micromonospora echinospora]OZV73540.1 universal stress protein UspA [Micromonospora echinospora]SCE70198.1 Nucleotide-binding universal stress protein, UspA family [Micromonospora echinospora]
MSAAADAPVVVGVSGSDESLPVVRLAAREAAEHGRRLSVLHAFNWEAALAAPSLAGARTEAEGAIDRAVGAAREVDADLPVDAHVVEGAAVAVLLRQSESAFLVVVGDGGMTTRDCVSPEAAAVQVASRAGCPTLVARLDPPPTGPVVVGLDGSATSRFALDFALDCAARHDGRLRAVRVVEPNGDGTRTEREVADLLAQRGSRHPAVTAEPAVLRGDPGQVLIDQSRSARLVVVGARGDQPWRGLLGAVSQSLLYHAPAPVVFIRGVTDVPLETP